MPLPSLNSLALWKLPENTLTQPMSGALPEGLASLGKHAERIGARACLEPQSGFLPHLDKLGGAWGALEREKLLRFVEGNRQDPHGQVLGTPSCRL